MAAGGEWNGLSQPCPVFHAARRDRLASAHPNGPAGVECLSVVFSSVHSAFPLLIRDDLWHTSLMFPALNLPDLDALDPAALKAMILAQHDRHRDQQDHFKAQHERYTATLSSRASEIERLALLVEKLQRMLFGARSPHTSARP